jgi:hypothetical protein
MYYETIIFNCKYYSYIDLESYLDVSCTFTMIHSMSFEDMIAEDKHWQLDMTNQHLLMFHHVSINHLQIDHFMIILFLIISIYLIWKVHIHHVFELISYESIEIKKKISKLSEEQALEKFFYWSTFFLYRYSLVHSHMELIILIWQRLNSIIFNGLFLFFDKDSILFINTLGTIRFS